MQQRRARNESGTHTKPQFSITGKQKRELQLKSALNKKHSDTTLHITGDVKARIMTPFWHEDTISKAIRLLAETIGEAPKIHELLKAKHGSIIIFYYS